MCFIYFQQHLGAAADRIHICNFLNFFALGQQSRTTKGMKKRWRARRRRVEESVRGDEWSKSVCREEAVLSGSETGSRAGGRKKVKMFKCKSSISNKLKLRVHIAVVINTKVTCERTPTAWTERTRWFISGRVSVWKTTAAAPQTAPKTIICQKHPPLFPFFMFYLAVNPQMYP